MNNRKLKIALHSVDPRCHWCHKPTILTNISHIQGKPPENMATIDHVVSRLDIRRFVQGQQKKVLACWKCNQERSRKEVLSLTRKEILRRSSEGFALNKGPDGKKIITQPVKKVEDVIDIFSKNGIILQTK